MSMATCEKGRVPTARDLAYSNNEYGANECVVPSTVFVFFIARYRAKVES